MAVGRLQWLVRLIRQEPACIALTCQCIQRWNDWQLSVHDTVVLLHVHDNTGCYSTSPEPVYRIGPPSPFSSRPASGNYGAHHRLTRKTGSSTSPLIILSTTWTL